MTSFLESSCVPEHLWFSVLIHHLIYQEYISQPSDIQQHLPVLKFYAEKSESIIELGFRGGVSTSALMAGKPKRLTIVDWDKPPFKIDRMPSKIQVAGNDFAIG